MQQTNTEDHAIYHKHVLHFRIDKKRKQFTYICGSREISDGLAAIIIFQTVLRIEYKGTQRLKHEDQLQYERSTTYKGMLIELGNAERICATNARAFSSQSNNKVEEIVAL